MVFQNFVYYHFTLNHFIALPAYLFYKLFLLNAFKIYFEYSAIKILKKLRFSFKSVLSTSFFSKLLKKKFLFIVPLVNKFNDVCRLLKFNKHICNKNLFKLGKNLSLKVSVVK